MFAKKSYVGICFTDTHAAVLKQRLNTLMMAAFAKPGNLLNHGDNDPPKQDDERKEVPVKPKKAKTHQGHKKHTHDKTKNK